MSRRLLRPRMTDKAPLIAETAFQRVLLEIEGNAEHRKRRGRWDRVKAAAWMQRRIETRRSVVARDVPRDLKDFVRVRLKLTWTDMTQHLSELGRVDMVPPHSFGEKVVLQQIVLEGHRFVINDQ